MQKDSFEIVFHSKRENQTIKKIFGEMKKHNDLNGRIFHSGPSLRASGPGEQLARFFGAEPVAEALEATGNPHGSSSSASRHPKPSHGKP